ncbi:MAG: nucleotide exchange factor GrpE [Chthoniobacterales bacterium]
MKKTSHHHHPEPTPISTAPEVEKEQKEASSIASLPKPEEEISTLKNQVEQYRDQSLRAAADLENYRKRMLREKEEIVRYANSSLLEKLLPIMDNFELGLSAARTAAEKDPQSQTTEIINGFSMVQRQLHDFLKDHGMESIDAVGQVFDPKLHEALGHHIDDTLPEGQVVSQLRRGYLLAGRLLRPASVIVSKGTSQSNG